MPSADFIAFPFIVGVIVLLIDARQTVIPGRYSDGFDHDMQQQNRWSVISTGAEAGHVESMVR
jgi:hypothetical protein